MTHPHPFRFGVNVVSDTWVETARKLELLGYSVLAVPDHFGMQLAYGPALAAVAAATTTLRIGTFVLDNDFRHPAVVAADAAMLDQLSGGRFELGLGAGWMIEDYNTSGIPFDPPGVRFRRFTESVRIIKGLFTNNPVTFAGEHYTVTNLEGTPKPVQKPHPPLLIGAGGRRMLQFAAQEASIISVLPQSKREGGIDWQGGMTATTVTEKIGLVRDTAGKRFDKVELNALIQRVIVTNDRQNAFATLAEQWTMTPEETAASPYALIGSVDEIVETLRERREQFGLSYLTVFDRHVDAFAPIVACLAGT